NHVSRNVPLNQARDRVVSDSKRLRKYHAAETDEQSADCRPPHPVNRQLVKRVLGPIDEIREQSGQNTRKKTRDRAENQPFGRDICRMRRYRKKRTESKKIPSKDRGGRTRQSNRNQASRFPFE